MYDNKESDRGDTTNYRDGDMEKIEAQIDDRMI